MNRNREQRRQKAILPLKINVEGETYLAHTLDISASGARAVMTSQLASGSVALVEFKHRRARATVVWCRPMKGRKYEYEIGLRMQNAGREFWGVRMSLHDPDVDVDAMATLPFAKVMSLLTLRNTAGSR
jgi:hypothetical protein